MRSNPMTSSVGHGIHWLVRILLGLIFVYAGAIKIAGVWEFSDAVAGFGILPNPLINIAALAFPVLEIILGVMLLVPSQTFLRISAFGIAVLNLIFIGVLFSAWSRGLNVNCGCFGFDFSVPTNWKIPLAVFRDFVFVGLALMLWRCGSERADDSCMPFFDGYCSICSKSVALIAHSAKSMRSSFAVLQGKQVQAKDLKNREN